MEDWRARAEFQHAANASYLPIGGGGMTSLINEYRRRHKAKFVWPINDGFCFFVKKNKPSLIVTTSESSRSLTSCESCSTCDSNLVVEAYIINAPFLMCSIKRVIHRHIRPDTDVCCAVDKFESGYEAVAIKSDVEADLFLWRTFMQLNPCGNDKEYRKMEQLLNDLKMPLRPKTIQSMLWMALNRKEIFQYYYENIYQSLMAGRRYILYR